MASSFPSSRTARPLAITAVMIGALLFSGCAPAEAPASSGSPSPSPSASSEPSPTSTTEPSDGTIVSEPVDLACEELVTLDDMYAFNPNISFVEDGQPAADTKAGQIAGMNGLTCQWANNSSNETIDIAVAKLPDDQLTALKNLAVTESTQVPTYGAPPVEGYFTVIKNQGEAQVFTGAYWVALRSVAFFEPGDAEQLAEAAIAHLPE
ncbi:hypothetical protein IWX78_002640 [Mycetocola sp. CAN_C7]|uniref:hypothetical protein n=1 Tax=Mycetocola sp. CAN_C7 TaxID=2787724 RepID=UPI0018CA0581